MSQTLTIVTTSSGAVYSIDNDELTWQRLHETRDIIGLERDDDLGIFGVTAGYMAEPVAPVVDESMYILGHDGRWVRTTPVVSIEEV